jgi:hypothetical protein
MEKYIYINSLGCRRVRLKELRAERPDLWAQIKLGIIDFMRGIK